LPDYNPNKRLEEATWLYSHIPTLLANAIHFRDSSLVIYACFETRNFLEKIEFYIIMAALTETDRAKYFKDLEKKGGLSSGFGKIIKQRAHTYITFMNALCKAKNVPFRALGYFDFRTSTRLTTELSQYCHLYSRLQPDLEFESDFIQNGLQLPGRVFQFLREKQVLDDVHGITITGIPPTLLKGDSLIILENWRSKKIKTEEELIELLRNSKNE
jgi:hypothetical protein